MQRVTLLDEKAVDEASLSTLGMLPALSSACLHLPSRLSLPPLDGFPALKTLELWGCLGSLNVMLDHVVSQNVRELTLRWDERGQWRLGGAFRPILNCSPLPLLRELRIFDDNKEPITENIEPFIDYQVLAPFASCSALCVLELNMRGIWLTCGEMDTLTSNWPGLKKLVVHSNLYLITLRHLELLGKNCPLIEELDLNVDLYGKANSVRHRPIKHQSWSMRRVRLTGKNMGRWVT